MRLVSEVRERLRALLFRAREEREMEAEMRFHLDMEAERLAREEGLAHEEACRRAAVAFGGEERFKEQVRDARGVTWMEHRARDLRYALRGLRNRPGFSTAVVLTLALGIGANAAMFSIVDELLFRPPPMMSDAGRVHRVYLKSIFDGSSLWHARLSYARYVDLTRDTRSFSRTALCSLQKLAIGKGTDTRQMNVGVVSASFFRVFDAPPALGRYFTAEEDEPPNGTPVAVLGHAFWEERYGGARSVLGQRIEIGATRYTIIGAAPKGFVGVWPEDPPAVFVPVSVVGGESGSSEMEYGLDWWKMYDWTWGAMLVERKPGVGVAQANADLNQAYVRSYETEREVGGEPYRLPPVVQGKPHAIASSVLRDRGPDKSGLARVAAWVGAMALIVWLIACVNVADLLLSRALLRRREIAVRLALGVSRARLAAQLLTESLVLAILGGGAGVILAQWGGGALRSVFLSGGSSTSDTLLGDPRTLFYAGAAAVLAGLLAGLAPLVRTRRVDLTQDLRQGAREGTRQRSWLRAGLLVFQGTLSVVLLIGAGLFVRSLENARTVPLGYDPSHVLEVNLDMRGVRLNNTQQIALRDRLRAAGAAIPGVTRAARRLSVPFVSYYTEDLRVQGFVGSLRKVGRFYYNAVSPGYFRTMGTRILRGRGIDATDVAGAPSVMVVSQAMARKLWPHANALGQCVRVGSDTGPCRTVVGIAENIKASDLGHEPALFYYVPTAQHWPWKGGLALRVRGRASNAARRIRKVLQADMPGASYVTVTPLSEIVGEKTQSWQAGATMFVFFGLLALLLAVVGFYNVISFNVGQRTHEMGVRVALGASRVDVTRLVVGDGTKLALAGVGLGVVIALAAGRWIEPLLFEESAQDPLVFMSVGVVLLVVAALASFLPARRAARVDPVQALQTE